MYRLFINTLFNIKLSVSIVTSSYVGKKHAVGRRGKKYFIKTLMYFILGTMFVFEGSIELQETNIFYFRPNSSVLVVANKRYVQFLLLTS